ncbi:hypothetical protein N7448_000282 [Penicillium atrosanguineum]|nr:hypothetical protein N7448_000282 [Penicillium atrosanguineum]
MEPRHNGTLSLDGQVMPICKESVYGDHLAYPEKGHVLVIKGLRVEGLGDALEYLPEDDDARAKRFRELGATYHARVSDYSPALNENGTTKRH